MHRFFIYFIKNIYFQFLPISVQTSSVKRINFVKVSFYKQNIYAFIKSEHFTKRIVFVKGPTRYEDDFR